DAVKLVRQVDQSAVWLASTSGDLVKSVVNDLGRLLPAKDQGGLDSLNQVKSFTLAVTIQNAQCKLAANLTCADAASAEAVKSTCEVLWTKHLKAQLEVAKLAELMIPELKGLGAEIDAFNNNLKFEARDATASISSHFSEQGLNLLQKLVEKGEG